ncbi:MAG: hypothetical protein ACTHXA_05395 [Gulosibacter sp.]|uniref:hypothetical protein n=1 Tax=Gulosibacter sp. TaxID=2817531 RepID=UPI003F8EB185
MTSAPPPYPNGHGYPPQQPPPQPQPAPPSSGLNGFGLTGLIIGVVGLAVCWIPFIGFAGIFIGFVGLVFGVLGLALDKYRGRRLLAIIGTIVSAIAVGLSMFLPFITGAWWTWNQLDESGVFDELEEELKESFETSNPDYGTDSETDDPTDLDSPGPAPSDFPEETGVPETPGSVRP